MASSSDQAVKALAAFNAAIELAAMLYDAYSHSDDTPEQKAAARAAAFDRLDLAITAIEQDTPPPLQP